MLQFDGIFQDFLQQGKNRQAINYSKEVAAYALNSAAIAHATVYGEWDQAASCMATAVELKDDNKYYSNLLYFLSRLENFQKAEEWAKVAMEKTTPDAQFYYNYATVLMNLRKYEESANYYRKAIELNPDDPMSHVQLGNVCLAIGNFEEGLKEDEWRFKAHSGLKRLRQRYNKPDWDGKSDLNGVRLLVINDQGFGDAIQFSRYISDLKDKGAYIIFEVQKELVDLFKGCSFIDEVYGRNEDNADNLPEYNEVISVVSLPSIIDSSLRNISLHPYLTPLTQGCKATDVLANYDGIKVGIIWAGNQWHMNDRDRSCPLKHFKTIANIPGVKLFSLQKGDMQRTWSVGASIVWEGNENIEVVDLSEGVDFEYVDLAPHINSFMDTAAVLKKLDLLICVDTSAAHLAGAMGVPVCLLLPYAHEWRWQKKWYESMRIFRQTSMGDWSGLMETVKNHGITNLQPE